MKNGYEATINNFGAIANKGTLYNNYFAALNNGGAIANAGDIANSGTLYNNGAIDNDQGAIANAGVIYNFGDIYNGIISSTCSGIYHGRPPVGASIISACFKIYLPVAQFSRKLDLILLRNNSVSVSVQMIETWLTM
jgi:hypothetical protein